MYNEYIDGVFAGTRPACTRSRRRVRASGVRTQHRYQSPAPAYQGIYLLPILIDLRTWAGGVERVENIIKLDPGKPGIRISGVGLR